MNGTKDDKEEDDDDAEAGDDDDDDDKSEDDDEVEDEEKMKIHTPNSDKKRKSENNEESTPAKRTNFGDGITKLFVGNLPFNATEDDLYNQFSTYGEITDVFLPVHKDTGNKRGEQSFRFFFSISDIEL
mmetsp:Transcript_45486/g.176931  ORF Transcript_45486/g.176931 Transcript_45486/m.176931 type:complete len:129 (+) Transcript_45486:648-1034(+)